MPPEVKRNLKTNALIMGVLLLVFAAVPAFIIYEILLWQECRLTNSWWYCLRILGR